MSTSSDDRSIVKQVFLVMQEIADARRTTMRWFVGYFVVGALIFLLFAQGGFVRTLFVWSSPLVLIPMLQPFWRIRCPYCGERPFLPSSKESFRRWRSRETFICDACVHCDSDLTFAPRELEPVPEGEGEHETRVRQ